MKRILFPLLLLTSSCVLAEQQVYVCTPDNAATQIAFLGKLFSVTVTPNCIKLVNLENKSKDWTWKIKLTNSLGDAEGSRQYCDKQDDGLIGNPAVWYGTDKKLITLAASFRGGPQIHSFSCVSNNTK
jgi:hypothetical protein